VVLGVPDADEAVCWKSLSGEACTKARTARDSIRTDQTHGSLSLFPPQVPPKQTFNKKFWDTWTALGYRQPKDVTK
jgi:hypothetical protein